MGEAYILPFNKVATFVPGYKGLIKLARQSKEVSTIESDVVREGDLFDYAKEFGGSDNMRPWMKHKPSIDPDRLTKPITFTWAAVTFRDGGTQFVVMTEAEVQTVKARSPSAKSKQGPWFDERDYPAMAKKTAIKRVLNFCRLSADLDEALERDNEFDAGIAPPPMEPDDIPPPQNLDDAADVIDGKDGNN